MKKWKIKALLHKVLSVLPWYYRWNYWLQRYVSRSLPLSAAQFQQKMQDAQEQIALFEQYGNVPVQESIWLEIGCGSDLCMGLAFTHRHGVKQLIATDLYPLLNISLANHNLQRMSENGLVDFHTFLRHKNELPKLRIQYLAPQDARHFSLPNESVDCICNTSVFEHISGDILPAIVAEAFRVLRKGGLLICVIDMQDHWSYTDSEISYYNFLQYEETAFKRLFNSQLQFQNRWRYVQYRQLFLSAGFTLLHEDLTKASAADLQMLQQMAIASHFKHFSLEDLGVRTAWVVARKA